MTCFHCLLLYSIQEVAEYAGMVLWFDMHDDDLAKHTQAYPLHVDLDRHLIHSLPAFVLSRHVRMEAQQAKPHLTTRLLSSQYILLVQS